MSIIKNESDVINLLPDLAYCRGFSITFLNAWKFEESKIPLKLSQIELKKCNVKQKNLFFSFWPSSSLLDGPQKKFIVDHQIYFTFKHIYALSQSVFPILFYYYLYLILLKLSTIEKMACHGKNHDKSYKDFLAIPQR